MKINITDPLDEENIRKFAKFKKLPLTKTLIDAKARGFILRVFCFYKL